MRTLIDAETVPGEWNATNPPGGRLAGGTIDLSYRFRAGERIARIDIVP